jgi:hypothetical protein
MSKKDLHSLHGAELHGRSGIFLPNGIAESKIASSTASGLSQALTPEAHSVQLGKEGAELRDEQRPQVRFVRVIVVRYVQ